MAFNAPPSSDTPKTSPRDAAIMLLARREYSRHELEERLTRKGHALDDIAPVLDALIDEGLQSDERFAEHFVRGHVLRGNGPLKILSGLRSRGIDKTLAKEALAASEVDWYSAACEALQKRFSGPGDSAPEKAKRLRFLASRGYESAHAYHAIEVAFSDE
ncbi:regulatory protein RecX [Larsenimonas salina]|uniref:regulatory protein RecX n=1 Tax=Larsenimonas salina TaxID=1295565 RepID=UPI0020741F0C|nr:regulatory protein RecX [Larsenimonas salina]MCM5705375.1 recombination regulator RecX [Larsenimonas salina]